MKKVTIAVQKRISFVNGVKSVGLIPVPEDADKIKHFHNNQILHIAVKGEVDPRSLRQLSLYWVCVNKLLQNSDFPSEKDVDEYVKKKCHYVEWFTDLNGKQTFRTKSISYENMDQPDFNVFMDNAIPVIANFLNVTEEDLLNSTNDIE
jgi:hypothetical protein